MTSTERYAVNVKQIELKRLWILKNLLRFKRTMATYGSQQDRVLLKLNTLVMPDYVENQCASKCMVSEAHGCSHQFSADFFYFVSS